MVEVDAEIGSRDCLFGLHGYATKGGSPRINIRPQKQSVLR